MPMKARGPSDLAGGNLGGNVLASCEGLDFVPERDVIAGLAGPLVNYAVRHPHPHRCNPTKKRRERGGSVVGNRRSMARSSRARRGFYTAMAAGIARKPGTVRDLLEAG